MALIYRGVTIEHRNHRVTLFPDVFGPQETEILTWCVENFGYGCDNEVWDLLMSDRTAHFTFLKETDAMAFRLRWI